MDLSVRCNKPLAPYQLQHQNEPSKKYSTTKKKNCYTVYHQHHDREYKNEQTDSVCESEAYYGKSKQITNLVRATGEVCAAFSVRAMDKCYLKTLSTRLSSYF